MLQVLIALTVLAAPEADRWKRVSPTDAGFTLEFPAPPSEMEQRVKAADGKSEMVVHTLAAADGETAYMAGWHDYPPTTTSADAILDGARDGALANTKGTLVSEKKIKTGAHPGRELVIQARGTTTHARIYWVKGRLIQMLAIMPEGQVVEADAKAFLDSFRLDEPAPPASKKKPK